MKRSDIWTLTYMRMDTTNDEARWRSERFPATATRPGSIGQTKISSATRDMGEGSDSEKRQLYRNEAYRTGQAINGITTGYSSREETDRRVYAATRNYTRESNL